MSDIPISETVTIKSLGFDEAWLQDQIWENPSCLGLGDLESVIKENVVSSGGRLDILLTNPNDDSMYEVEVMLGDTDPSHIIRTIEYWDLTKRKWPQRQHFAVLVAERITKRFFNVIQILSGAVPLIAIQANIVKSLHGSSLHFTKVLDVYEEPEIGETPDGTCDEAYWVKKSNETLIAARLLLEATSNIYEDAKLGFNKHSIVISVNAYNQMVFRKRSGGYVRIQLRYGDKRDEIQAVLDENGIQYNDKYHQFMFQMPAKNIEDRLAMLVRIAELNKQWWSD